MFQSNDFLEENIVNNHAESVTYALQVTSSEEKECSLCEDTLRTNEEFKSHVSDPLEKIIIINVDYLKSGH